jgi:serine/threonine protein kinase/tetratricopeptide (TPR) repeat protein
MSRTQRLAEPENFGKYQLIARLAHGRMGDVYKAKSHGLEGFERILVIKTIQPGLAAIPGFVDIVVEEAQKAVALSHSNVAQVIDLGREEQGNRVYIATEFINGLDLVRAIKIATRANTPFPLELLIFIGSEIAQGLDHAHRRKDFNFNPLNLLHRDLTPQSIMLGQDGAVKITDFGVSRAMELAPPVNDHERRRRALYAAPELLRGEQHTPRSDLFSLGLILYELLTGSHPYVVAGEDADTTIARAAAAQIPQLTNVSSIPRPLAQVVDALLVPDPNGRTSSAGQVYEELVGYIFGNNLSADARMLGLLVQELRKEEVRLFPESVSKEVGLDEISMSELKIPDAAKSLYGEEEETNHLQRISEATSAALPRQKLDHAIHGDDHGASPLPGSLEDYFRAARAGRGKTVLLYGSPGAGKDYLPDRLVDALGTRGNTLARAVQATPDDAMRPFGVLGDALVQLLREHLPPQTDPYKGAIDALSRMTSSQAAIQTLSGVWGLAPAPRIGAEQRRLALVEAWTQLLDTLCRVSAVVLIIDQIEHLDPVSMEVLRALIPIVGARPAMLVLATEQGERMRQSLDTGNAEHLGAAKIIGPEPPRVRDLGDLDPDQREVLALLAILQRPMPQAELSQLLGLPSDRVMAAIKTLVGRGAVRVPSTGMFFAGMPELGMWAEQTFGKRGVQQRAALLARATRARLAHHKIDRLTPTLIRLYAASGDRRRLLSAGGAYVAWLHSEGWLHSAMSCYRRLAELIGSESLGVPQEQVSYLLARAELALELSMIEECRASLAPITALAERARHDRGLIRGQLLLGQMELHNDDVDAAHRHFTRAIEAARNLRDPDLLARSMTAFAGWHERFGDTRRGQQMVEGALNLIGRTAGTRLDPVTRAITLSRAVNVLCTRGMSRYAQRSADDLAQLAASTKLTAVECRSALANARILATTQRRPEAITTLLAAIESAHAHGLTAMRIELMRQLVTVSLDQGDLQTTYKLAGDLAALAGAHSDTYSQQRAQDMQALSACLMGQDVTNALGHLQYSLQRATSRNVPKDIWRCHASLDRAMTALGRHDEAAAHRAHAARLSA